MVHFLFIFCPTFSVAPYLQNAPAIPVCSIQPCVLEGKARIWMCSSILEWAFLCFVFCSLSTLFKYAALFGLFNKCSVPSQKKKKKKKDSECHLQPPSKDLHPRNTWTCTNDACSLLDTERSKKIDHPRNAWISVRTVGRKAFSQTGWLLNPITDL